MKDNTALRPSEEDGYTLSATGAVAIVLGSGLVLAGRRRGGALGLLAGIAGLFVAARAMRGPAEGQLIRAGTARRRIRLSTSILVDRPVHEVFEFCHDFENFPRVVHGLRSVIDFQDGRSHWSVFTPTGDVLEWDVVVTKYVPNSVIAWRSKTGSPVDMHGVIRFSPAPGGGTHLAVEVAYLPRETELADAMRALVRTRGEARLRTELRDIADAVDAAAIASRDDRSFLSETLDPPPVSA